MNPAEFLALSKESVQYKFVASMAQLMMWTWIPQNKKPFHAEIAVQVGLAKNLSDDKQYAELLDSRDFRAGSFKVRRSEFSPDEASTAFMYNYPEWEEFEALTTDGKINLLQPAL